MKLGSGVEIWGYNEFELVEGIKKTYLKWCLGVDRSTPDSILRREVKECKMWVDSIQRVITYEEKICKLNDNDIRKEIWRKKVNKIGILNKYDKEREKIWSKLGLNGDGLSNWDDVRNSLSDRARENAEKSGIKEDLKRIKETRYAERIKEVLYKDWEGEKIPKYLMDGKYVKSLARFRSGNELKHSYFWRDEADKMCRICKDGEEDARHVFEMCKLNKNKIKWELV